MSALPAELNDIMKLHAGGKPDEARTGYLRLLETHPNNAEILHLTGLTYFQSGDITSCREYLKDAAKHDPRNFKHVEKLVEIETKLGNPDLAIEALDTYLKKCPEDTKAVQELMNLGLNSRIFEPVIHHLGNLIRRHPADPTLRQLMVLTLTEAGRFGEAAPHYEVMMAANSLHSAGLIHGYGKSLHWAGEAERCIPMVEEWKLRFPADAELHVLQASNYTALGRVDDTIAEYKKLINLVPDRASYHFSLSLMEFLGSEMENGYDNYLWRHRLDHAVPYFFPIPEWKGESLEGKRLVLWAEQGIGDIFMFLSLLPPLLKEAKKVTLAVYPKLHKFLQQSFPELEVIDSYTGITEHAAERFDVHCALGELMRYMLPRYTPAEHAPFLKADKKQSEALRSKYLKMAKERGAKRLVGISWHTTNTNSSLYRNIALEHWTPLFKLKDIQFVSLQYSDHKTEIDAINKEYPGTILVDTSFDAYEDTAMLAAQIAAMDEVVTIQNATAHMAGGLGVPTTLLLSAASDWRWGMQRSDSRWYKSVKIIRQKTILQWLPVMREAAKKLSEK